MSREGSGVRGRHRRADGALRRALIASDVAAVTVAWALALLLVDRGPTAYGMVVWVLIAALLTVPLLAHQQLYLARVWAVRAVEVQRVGRGNLIAAALLLVVDVVVAGPLTPPTAAFAIVVSCALVVCGRMALLAHLGVTGNATAAHRCVLVAGDVDGATALAEELTQRPRLGYDVIGFVSCGRPDAPTAVPWIGTPGDLPVLTRLTACESVIVGADSFADDERDRVLARLQPLDVHTHLAARDDGGAVHLRVLPLPARGADGATPTLSTVQRAGKRAFDIVGGVILAAGALPIVLAAAAALRVTDGGPALLREVCVGPDGTPVVVYRLRTHVSGDGRAGTAVCHAIRRLGIDRLPQLVNVLTGSMTLVGPRPQRHAGGTAPMMAAGVFGFRYVQTPDYPELAGQRRADEFYVEHWSVGLDLSIIAACASDLVWRVVRGPTQRRAGDTAPV